MVEFIREPGQGLPLLKGRKPSALRLPSLNGFK
jgi:hypothetical protein